MITKKQLDTYFNENYEAISRLTQNIINQHNRKYEPSTLLANGYEYLLNKKNEIPDNEIQQWLITYIRNNIKWENSQIRKEERIQDNVEINDYYDQIDDEDDINDKIESEIRYTKQKDILNQYRNHYLKDKQKQIIFDVYFVKLQSSCRKMGKHFDIHYVSAHKLIKEMKEDLNYFINNVYNNNNNIK
jgi:hypothetical protein